MNNFILEEKQQRSATLIWSHISVTSSNKSETVTNGQSNQLLKNLSGIAKAGEILAVMGASGVGKTTLMNILSGRHSHTFQTTGEVYVNNYLTTSKERAQSCLIGHIEQHELFFETITTKEHLLFQAMLRRPYAVTDEERHSFVDSIILELHLDDCETTTIGHLSGGEKKRLAFATALLTNPRVLLIDEPTSGLDTYLAKSLMSIIHSMAVKQNQAIVVVLHQPTSAILDVIDALYLLVEGGQQGFFGTKKNAQQFFHSECHLSSSSLDGLIEQLSAPPDISDEQGVVVQKLVADQYVKSEYLVLLDTTINNYLESIDKNDKIYQVGQIEHATFGCQLKWLLWRSMINSKRNPLRTTKLIFRVIIVAFIVGIVFFRTNHYSDNFIQNVNAVLFLPMWMFLESNTSLLLAEIPAERVVVIWEYRRQLYSVGAYYLSRLIVDICYQITTAVVFISIVVIMTGLHHWILLVCALILIVLSTCSLTAFVASLASTPQTALLVYQPIQAILTTLSGYLVNLNSVSVYLIWIKYISVFYYGLHLLLVIQWHDTNIHLPCNNYISSNESVTYLNTSNVNTCEVAGNSVLSCFSASYGHTLNYIIGLILLTVIFHLGAFVATFIRIRRAI